MNLFLSLKRGVRRTLYIEGSDPQELHLPSKTANPENQGHNIPFPPISQTAKNVGTTVKCHECGKQRLLYAKNKLKSGELERFKRLQNDYIYVCGGSFNEIEICDRKKDTLVSQKIFSRENLSFQAVLKFHIIPRDIRIFVFFLAVEI